MPAHNAVFLDEVIGLAAWRSVPTSMPASLIVLFVLMFNCLSPFLNHNDECHGTGSKSALPAILFRPAEKGWKC